MLGQLADRVDLLNTIGSKFDLRGEEVNTLILVQRAVDEGRFNDTLFTLSSLEQALGEASTSHSHGESSRTSTVLSLDDLITTELNAVDQVIELLASDVGVAGLGDQGNDSDARVSTNDGDVLVCWVGLLDFGDETGGTDNVKGGDTEETLGVVDTLPLEDFGNDGYGRVDLCMLEHAQITLRRKLYGVGNDEDVGVGCGIGSSLCKVSNNTGIGVEEICEIVRGVKRERLEILTISGHAWLSRNTSWDEDDFGTGQALSQTRWSWVVAFDCASSVDMADISSDT